MKSRRAKNKGINQRAVGEYFYSGNQVTCEVGVWFTSGPGQLIPDACDPGPEQSESSPKDHDTGTTWLRPLDVAVIDLDLEVHLSFRRH